MEQAEQAVAFINRQLAQKRAVAVYCDAGLGRTGTLLAAYLISQAETAAGAIERIRNAKRVALETERQIQFLHEFAASRVLAVSVPCTNRAVVSSGAPQ